MKRVAGWQTKGQNYLLLSYKARSPRRGAAFSHTFDLLLAGRPKKLTMISACQGGPLADYEHSQLCVRYIPVRLHFVAFQTRTCRGEWPLRPVLWPQRIRWTEKNEGQRNKARRSSSIWEGDVRRGPRVGFGRSAGPEIYLERETLLGTPRKRLRLTMQLSLHSSSTQPCLRHWSGYPAVEPRRSREKGCCRQVKQQHRQHQQQYGLQKTCSTVPK